MFQNFQKIFLAFYLVIAVHILHLETVLQNALVSYKIIREVFKKNGYTMRFKDY